MCCGLVRLLAGIYIYAKNYGVTDQQWHRRELLDGAGGRGVVVGKSPVESRRGVRGRRSAFVILRP